MQELAFPEIAKSPTEPFDDYTDVNVAHVGDAHVCLFMRVDANGKHHYLVAERWPWDTKSLVLTNAKEFKHAHERAVRYFDRRRSELAP